MIDYAQFAKVIRNKKGQNLKPFSLIIQENKIKSLEEGINCEELWDINNGRTLCRLCHDKTKNGRPKRL